MFASPSPNNMKKKTQQLSTGTTISIEQGILNPNEHNGGQATFPTSNHPHVLCPYRQNIPHVLCPQQK